MGKRDIIPVKEIESAKNGDRIAFGSVVARYQDATVAYAASVLKDLDKAHDAAQDAFLEAFLQLPKLRTPQAFPKWLQRIVFKHCDRILRKHELPLTEITALTDLRSDERPLDDLIVRRELYAAVWSAVDSLSEEHRAVILLFYMASHSYREAACFLGIPPKTVKSRLYSARILLKERLISVMQDDQFEHAVTMQKPSRDQRFMQQVQFLPAFAEQLSIEMKHQLDNLTDLHPVQKLPGSVAHEGCIFCSCLRDEDYSESPEENVKDLHPKLARDLAKFRSKILESGTNEYLIDDFAKTDTEGFERIGAATPARGLPYFVTMRDRYDYVMFQFLWEPRP